MAVHLPILQIVVPLIAAPVCLLLRRRMLAWAFAAAVGWIVFGIAALLLVRVLDAGTVSYALGSWSAPWGIEYRIDTVNAFVLLLVAFIGAVVLLYAPPSAAREIPHDRHYLFYAAYLLCLTGLLGIAITGDAFNLFVFLEISSLSTYALISLGEDRRALTASYQYLVMGTVGATFILIGVGLLYMATGTLNMADLAVRLGSGPGQQDRAGRVRVPRRRPVFETGAVSPAHVAARCVLLCAVHGNGLPRGNSDQGLHLRSPAVRLHRFRTPFRIRYGRIAGGAVAAFAAGCFRGLCGRHFPDERQTHARLVQRCPGRLHHAGSRLGCRRAAPRRMSGSDRGR